MGALGLQTSQAQQQQTLQQQQQNQQKSSISGMISDFTKAIGKSKLYSIINIRFFFNFKSNNL